jgi:hypothetical protein
MFCKLRHTLCLLFAFASLACTLHSLTATQVSERGAKRVGALARQLVGVWQASKFMAAGWNESIQFFPDGTFKIHASQMDCQLRERGRSGTWQANQSQLHLVVTQRFVVVGGRLVSSKGSCGSNQMIEGGKTTTRKVTPPQRQKLALTFAKPDETKRMTLRLNGKQFWKFSSNPSDYN